MPESGRRETGAMQVIKKGVDRKKSTMLILSNVKRLLYERLSGVVR